ncbi:MAG TPA: serine/threonine-protein kinase [Gemmatimonas sp.]|nr:serine/threonine-protein kinase [Gemmatimonas sp.]
MPDFQSRLQQAIDREFLIERELTGAGMSRVFVATERKLQRRVVVKVLPPELAAGMNVDRFRREIQLAAGLQHPHIVPLISAGDDDGLLWFSMPYIEGESLRSALKEHRSLPARDVVRILHDVVDALAYAHDRGVVHRDIKPENILRSGMHAMVTDFGVAKAVSAAIPSQGGTTTGMAIGTPAYMAPEQLAADPAADHRVDIYAVGLLAYELLTGVSPFTSTSPQATLAAQLTKTPEAPHRLFSEIPEALSAIIMHCLEKDAARRPVSAAALLAELDALPPMGSGSSLAPARRRSRRGPVVFGSIAVIAALSVVFAQRAKLAGAASGNADSVPARDIGPGGSRTGMEVANGGALGAANTPATRPETVIVIYRDTSLSADRSGGVQVPVVISRAESLAIAKAMQGPTAPAPAPALASGAVSGVAGAASGSGSGSAPADGAFNAADASRMARVFVTRPGGDVNVSVDQEALFREVRRVFSDSMSKALHSMDSALARMPKYVGRPDAPRTAQMFSVVPSISPNADGRTRVVVSDFVNATRKPEMAQVATDLSRFLRGALPRQRFDVVSSELTWRVSRDVPDRMAMGWTLRSDYVVSGVLRARNDSLVLLAQFTDVRGGHYSRQTEMAGPISEPRQVFDAALERVNVWLDSARTREANRPPMPPSSPQRRGRGPDDGRGGR